MHTKKNNSIVFFFPYYDVSGVPVLFLRFAEALSERNHQVSIVDFKNGYMHSHIKNNKKIEFIPFKKNAPLLLPKDSTIILQSILPQTLPKNLLFDKSNKIIFWTLYQANFVPTIIPMDRIRNFQYSHPRFFRFFKKTILKRYINSLSEMINNMHAKGGLFFMSYDVFYFTSKFIDLNFDNPKLMPVCIDSSSKVVRYNTIKENMTINILWIGRLGDFKIHILNYLIKSLNKSKFLEEYKINLSIIGSGSYWIKKPSKINKNFSIIQHKNIGHNQVEVYLLQTDICASMGTSAIESARYGIPTIGLDFYYSKIDFNYIFKWIFKKNRYDLGSLIDSKDYEDIKHNKIDERINEVIENYSEISEKTFQYFNENHDINNFISTFEKEVNNSSFYYTDFDKKIFQESVTRKLYKKLRSLFMEDVW